MDAIRKIKEKNVRKVCCFVWILRWLITFNDSLQLIRRPKENSINCDFTTNQKDFEAAITTRHE